MSRPATTRPKVNPPLGRMPVLQFIPPAELQIDRDYQRSLDTASSQSLIRKIAQYWNWDLCQVLVVARRKDGGLYVIDGQHRLEAARLRRDLGQLPCVVVESESPAEEAASFVHLNQQRRPLTKLDLFKAAVASEDPEACAILEALQDAGLSVAPHSNYTTWKPGMVSNIGGIEAAWRKQGPAATRRALKVMASAYKGKVLRYGGTIFPGIVAVCYEEVEPGRLERFANMVGSFEQEHWRAAIAQVRVEDPNIKFAQASAKVFVDTWREHAGTPLFRAVEAPAPIAAETVTDFTPPPADKKWCEQCDRMQSLKDATLCKDRFCKIRPRLRA